MAVPYKKLSYLVLLLLGLWSLQFAYPDYEEYRSFSADKPPHESVKAYNDLFASSEECIACHGHDTAGIASFDGEGNDVNVVDHWRSTMMANSAKDPFWRAKVSHETLLFPDQKDAIETSCTDCHAPLGFFNAQYLGQNTYTIADMLADSLALDGVSCLACHQQSDENLGRFFNGQLTIEESHFAYGQYISPLISPMAIETGYIPVYSPHIEDAGLCAGCHTLITETLDESGNPVGNRFVEQATYHEWLNSIYNEVNTTCQNCHMPSLGGQSIFIAAGYETTPRSPFYLHEFVGANVQMLRLLKSNRDTLQLNSNDEQFDFTINRTMQMLQNQSIEMEMEVFDSSSDSLYVKLNLKNLAGHRFPSGYPSRRLVVQFVATDEGGDTILFSGAFNEDFSLKEENEPFESHYNTIISNKQVQIYEMVMGNSVGEVTTVLNRAYEPLKDNRLVPVGFSTQHFAYDTTQLYGAVQDDYDFNLDNGFEGTGMDGVQYHIPINGSQGMISVTCNLYYQTLHPRWLNEMFNDSTAEIHFFESMINSNNLTPILVKSITDSFEVPNSVDELNPSEHWIDWHGLRAFGVEVELREKALITAYAIDGRVLNRVPLEKGTHRLSSAFESSIIIWIAQTSDGKKSVHRTINP